MSFMMIAICDDDRNIIDQLAVFLREIFDEKTLVQEFTDPMTF